MKTLILAFLASASLCFGGAIVNFHLQDSFGRILPNCKVTLQPVPNLASVTNAPGQITGDFLTFVTDTNANYSATNVEIGTYRQIIYGPSATTTNYILVLSTNTINAKDWLTKYPTGIGLLLYEEAGVVAGRITLEP